MFAASASPKSNTKRLAMTPSSTVHGSQYDTKYVAFGYLLHAAFNSWLTQFGVLLLNQPVDVIDAKSESTEVPTNRIPPIAPVLSIDTAVP